MGVLAVLFTPNTPIHFLQLTGCLYGRATFFMRLSVF